jgi:hypothetical protein
VLNNFFKSRTAPRRSELAISVAIAKSVYERISSNLSGSSIEDGGKLLGSINQTGKQLSIRVDAYIDSGPRVSSSTTHLHPDGEYQEAMFRVIEIFDPTIEHIGSWHSHHCNGLERLSDGDIEGYIRTVNKPDYNLDVFLAFLIIGLNRSTVKARYYVFLRGNEEWFELDESTVSILPEASPLDPILLAGEATSREYRSQHTFLAKSGATAADRRMDSKGEPTERNQSDAAKQLRAEDQRWIKDAYPSAKASLNKKSGAIAWTWTIPTGWGQVDVKYIHPGKKTPFSHARLEARQRGHLVLSEDIAFTDARFFEIRDHLKRFLDFKDPG